MSKASGKSTILPLWQDKLRHMLGAGVARRKQDHGFRNYYCASVGSEDHAVMKEMERAGLVGAGRFINNSRDQYFHATADGCKAIGLSKAAIARAFEN